MMSVFRPMPGAMAKGVLATRPVSREQTAAVSAVAAKAPATGMPVASSQYWNSIHGRAPGEAEQDGEGRQTMRTLARNIAWITKCIEAGKQAGIDYPTHEPVIMTNFID